MDMILLALVGAVIVEGIVEYAKSIYKGFTGGQAKTAITQVVSIVLGVLLSAAGGWDVFAALGVTFLAPGIGVVLTGIVISRGSNYASDIIKRISGILGKA